MTASDGESTGSEDDDEERDDSDDDSEEGDDCDDAPGPSTAPRRARRKRPDKKRRVDYPAEQLKTLLAFTHIDDEVTLPPPATLDVHVDAAIAFRAVEAARCDRKLCAICSIPKPRGEVQTLPIPERT
jgi:hypothetical protein